MEFIRGLPAVRQQYRGAVLTIGNFDGVHLGHQALLAQLRQLADQHQKPLQVMVFEPQPQTYFAAHQAPARLTPLRDKYQALARYGVDQLLCIPFRPAFITLTAQQFVTQVLHQTLAPTLMMVGEDFRFGANRSGDITQLTHLAAAQGIPVLCAPTFRYQQQRVSSTQIRQLLQRHQLQQANACLGRPYTLSGRVQYGKGLGRQIGFPTANILLRQRPVALHGVYAVWVKWAQQSWHPAVANVGYKPTLGQQHPQQLEVHIFDLPIDVSLYQRHITVLFQHHLRHEQRFASVDALTQQIQQDIQVARQQLRQTPDDMFLHRAE